MLPLCTNELLPTQWLAFMEAQTIKTGLNRHAWNLCVQGTVDFFRNFIEKISPCTLVKLNLLNLTHVGHLCIYGITSLGSKTTPPRKKQNARITPWVPILGPVGLKFHIGPTYPFFWPRVSRIYFQKIV